MFPNHEGISTFLSVNFLKELVKMGKINEKEMQDILFIINAHVNIMKYGNSKKHWEMYKYEPDKINLIQTFSKYDTAGSISDIELKQDVSIEITPEKFSPQNNNEPVVYFTIGISNSGKLEWLKENYKNNIEIISRDNILLEYGKKIYGNLTYSELLEKLTKEDQKEIDKLFDEKLSNFQENKKNFIIDMSLVSYKNRKGMLNKIKKFYNIEYINFLTDFKDIMKINNNNESKFVDKKVLVDIMKNYQYPLYGEDNRISNITTIIGNNLDLKIKNKIKVNKKLENSTSNLTTITETSLQF